MKHILLISFFLLTSFVNVIAQCVGFRILDFSNGKVLTNRISQIDFINGKLKKSELYFNKEMNIDEIKSMEIKHYIDSFFNNTEKISEFSLWQYVYLIQNGGYSEKMDAFNQLMLHNYQDTVFYFLKSYIISGKSSSRKINYIKKLRFFNDKKSIPILEKACNDSCIYVRLEAARELSYRGEKNISYKTFKDIWDKKIKNINLDKFPYFTVGMRNIATPEALDFLYMLSRHKNYYCALDASICLLQLKMKYEGMAGLEYVLSGNNIRLIKSAIYSMLEYFNKEDVINHLNGLLQSENKNIVDFAISMLNSLNEK